MKRKKNKRMGKNIRPPLHGRNRIYLCRPYICFSFAIAVLAGIDFYFITALYFWPIYLFSASIFIGPKISARKPKYSAGRLSLFFSFLFWLLLLLPGHKYSLPRPIIFCLFLFPFRGAPFLLTLKIKRFSVKLSLGRG